MSNPVSPNSTQLYIGIDGGGTSCRARIEDAEGNVLGQGTAGPATTRIGVDTSMQAVRTAGGAAGVGLAGIDLKGAGEALMSVTHPFQDVVFASDANVACLGAHRGRDGGIVV